MRDIGLICVWRGLVGRAGRERRDLENWEKERNSRECLVDVYGATEKNPNPREKTEHDLVEFSLKLIVFYPLVDDNGFAHKP